MSTPSHFAHSLEGHPVDEWEPLEVHLHAVATLAEQYAGKFGAAPWGRIIGLWHDIGKYSAEFQTYLRNSNDPDASLETRTGRVDHSTAGAQHAYSYCPAPAGELIAYCIAGHHSGLLDRSALHGRSDLRSRLEKTICDWHDAPAELMSAVELPTPVLTLDHCEGDRAAFQIALFTRMLFSSLVDADFLATEAYMSPEKSRFRPGSIPTFRDISNCLDRHVEELAAGQPDSNVNRIRGDVLSDCRGASHMEPGFFSLTVPTGGGKTLSSLSFALRHADRHSLSRIICAIPFTSIIEQTASVYRDALSEVGADIVIEHHSNVDPDVERENVQSRLAAENWDAPVIVTTNVQLFESMFAARTSRCRKLHRIVGSIIILDEAQTLPVGLLRPCLAVLRELVTDYGCTVVLCSATQPALEYRDGFPIGVGNDPRFPIREIVSRPDILHAQMKRASAQQIGTIADGELSKRLVSLDQVLCIVNTRAHAVELYKLIQEGLGDDSGVFHLSTYMCGKHRSEKFEEIKNRLDQGLPCRVVSTQLVEAGVDVDFPVVYRALSGIDSIAQAAGRCNREGRADSGDVFVFVPRDVALRGYLASTAASAAEILEDASDILSPETIRNYFELHYWKQCGGNQWDDNRVMECFPVPVKNMHFQFRTAASAFRFIRDIGRPLIVSYGEEGQSLLEKFREVQENSQAMRLALRSLQRYTVSIPEQVYDAMVGSDIEILQSGYAVLLNENCYDNDIGFRANRAGYHDPGTLISS